jgi:hypothetical protein
MATDGYQWRECCERFSFGRDFLCSSSKTTRLTDVMITSRAVQVITNACATQAIVSVLLNCSHEDLKLGDTLTEFKDFSQAFDAHVRHLQLRTYRF